MTQVRFALLLASLLLALLMRERGFTGFALAENTTVAASVSTVAVPEGSFTAQNDKGETVVVPLDKNTVLLAVASWCGACHQLLNYLQTNPKAMLGKKVILIYGDEWTDAEQSLKEGLMPYIERNIISESTADEGIKAYINKKRLAVHPMLNQPEEMEAAGKMQILFAPANKEGFSPFDPEFFPSAYDTKTKKFTLKAADVLRLQ
jgi:thiol-disulfide isomerase/thioredoxin